MINNTARKYYIDIKLKRAYYKFTVEHIILILYNKSVNI